MHTKKVFQVENIQGMTTPEFNEFLEELKLLLNPNILPKF